MSQAAAVLDTDPYSAAVIRDPYAFHRQLRQHPAVFLSAHGVYATGRYEEACVAFTDHTRFSTTSGIGLADARIPGPTARPLNPLLEVDPPDHTALRKVVNRVMSPAVIRDQRIKMTHAAQQMVAELPTGSEVEAVDEIVESFIFKVFIDAVGVRFDRDAIKAIGNLNGNITGPQNELFHESLARATPYMAWFEESQQREHVAKGGIAEQFFLAEDSGEIAPGTAALLTRTFVRGGTDSTIAAIGSTLHHLSRDPARWAALRSRPEKIRAAFEEGMRLETPFQVSFRYTLCDTELGGVAIPAGHKVGIYMGAANRDPARWQNPDVFDLDRVTQGHVAFGVGAHNCIGQMLARLEAECLLAALLARFSRVEPAGEPVWRLINQVRTLAHLPLKLAAH